MYIKHYYLHTDSYILTPNFWAGFGLIIDIVVVVIVVIYNCVVFTIFLYFQWIGKPWFSNSYVDPYLAVNSCMEDLQTFLGNLIDDSLLTDFDHAVALTRFVPS